MQKEFIWDPNMRSSALKYDPCLNKKGSKCSLQCSDCKLTLIADRFLGKEFQQEVLGKMGSGRGRYPYVIIADTFGCNLNCWFCYAYKFLDKEVATKYRCETSFVSPQRLAEQFGCKIEKMTNFDEFIGSINKKPLSESEKEKTLNHLKMKLPLMRLRISGGEPLYSTNKTLRDIKGKGVTEASIAYWLSFFEELDKIIGHLKKSKKLFILNKSDFQNSEWSPPDIFPACVGHKPGRLNIRFDTNGILFCSEKVTHSFINGIYQLFQNKKLKHIYIEIDYSFKGTNYSEYAWSQRKDLPVDINKSSSPVKRKHPQLVGYKVFMTALNHHYTSNKAFSEALGITVERGINHRITKTGKNSVWVNHQKSLEWDLFRKQHNINFSIVDNPIDLLQWRNNKPKRCYIDRGANINVLAENSKFDLLTAPSLGQLDNFVNRNDGVCNYTVFPIDEVICLKNEKANSYHKKNNMKYVDFTGENSWVFSGNKENVMIALEKSIWGIKDKHRLAWDAIKNQDLVFLYVTNPVSRIIALLKVEKTFCDDNLLWPDEMEEKKVKYPLRIKFSCEKVLPFEKWSSLGLRAKNEEVRHGINHIKVKRAQQMLKRLNF